MTARQRTYATPRFPGRLARKCPSTRSRPAAPTRPGGRGRSRSPRPPAAFQEADLAARLRRPSIGFFAICLGYFAIILDGSVLNVAIPAIRRDLHGTLSAAQWVLNAYTLTLAGLLLTVGALGDRIGLRRIFLVGAAVFTAASAACAAAPTILALIGERVVQGLGAAALLPATLALIPHLFPDPRGQARAAVVWVGIGAGAVALGPLVGGALIDAFGWRSIFLINLPIGIVSVLVGAIAVSETPRHARAVDRFGQVTAIVALGLLTAAIIHGGESGWGSPLTVGMLVAGALVAAAFWLCEHRVAQPMLPPRFFSDRRRTVAVVSAALMGFLFYGTLFMMSLYFQELRGWTPGRTGVALLPLTVGTLVGPFVLYARLSGRFGHPPLLVAGFACCAIGVGLLAGTDAHTAYAVIGVGLLLIGLASTVAFSALTSLLVASVSGDQSGLASGVQNTTRQTGALMAVSILGAVLNAHAFQARLGLAFGVLGIAVVVAVGVASMALRPTAPRRRSARR
jgi:MFS transporter, DHA2 family, methylenomycin A resistance protein